MNAFYFYGFFHPSEKKYVPTIYTINCTYVPQMFTAPRHPLPRLLPGLGDSLGNEIPKIRKEMLVPIGSMYLPIHVVDFLW